MNALGYPDYLIFNGYRNKGVSFNGGGADVNGCYWYLDGSIDGWDSPDVRGQTLNKIGDDPGADGEILTDAHYKGRTLAFCLYAECPTEAARQAARNLISEVLDLFPTVYTPAGGTFFANEVVPVRLDPIFRFGNSGQGKLKLTDQGYQIKNSQTVDLANGHKLAGLPEGQPAWLLKAEIELYTPDPRKYGQSIVGTTTTNGRIDIANVGNTGTQKGLITLFGTGGNGPYTITVSDNETYAAMMTLVVPTVPSGAPPLSGFPASVNVDLLSRTIEDGGGQNFYYLRDLTTPWLSIPPGPDVTITSNCPNFGVNFRPAWV